MNIKVLGEYLCAIRHIIEVKQEYFHTVFEIDTSKKTQDEVGKEVTTKTLNTLKNLLMERIGYFKNTKKLINLFTEEKNCLSLSDIESVLPPLSFDFRDRVEANDNYIQPIPIGVITNKYRDKVLVIKKNKTAVSSNSPEKDKDLIYVGGHTRFEDKTSINKQG